MHYHGTTAVLVVHVMSLKKKVSAAKQTISSSYIAFVFTYYYLIRSTYYYSSVVIVNWKDKYFINCCTTLLSVLSI